MEGQPAEVLQTKGKFRQQSSLWLTAFLILQTGQLQKADAADKTKYVDII